MKKVAIVCGSPSTEMDAPFGNPDYEVWVLGNRCHRYPSFDRIFEIHNDLTQHGDILAYAESLEAHGKPMVVGEQFPLPAEVYPYKQAQDLVGSTYLTSSSAYMVAYAILQGAKHIELYGVDMAVDDHEYFWQRPCMEFWVGFAKGRGIEVVIPEASPLCKSDYVEGWHHGNYKPATPFRSNEYADLAAEHASRVREAQEALQGMQDVLDRAEHLKSLINAHGGAQQAYERMAKVQRALDDKQPIKSLKDTVRMA